MGVAIVSAVFVVGELSIGAAVHVTAVRMVTVLVVAISTSIGALGVLGISPSL